MADQRNDELGPITIDLGRQNMDLLDFVAKYTRRLQEEEQTAVLTMCTLGWELIYDEHAEGVTMKSPDGKTRVLFSPLRPKTEKELRRMRAMLSKYVTPDMVAVMEDGMSMDEYLDRNSGFQVTAVGLEEDLPAMHCGKAPNHKQHRWESWAKWPRREDTDWEDLMAGIVWCSGKKEDMITSDRLDRSQLKSFAASVQKLLLELCNEQGIKFRVPDGNHILLYPPDGSSRPFKISASRPAEDSLTFIQSDFIRKYLEKPAQDPTPAPHVVSEQPYLAKYSAGEQGGKSYPSDCILEQKMSDGTTRYKCTKCDYLSENHLSVRNHHRLHVNSGEATRFDPATRSQLVVDDPTYTRASSYTPRQSSIEKLAEIIRNAASLIPEELAETILKAQHTEPQQSREPLTDAEVIDRIRRLVDRGEYVEQRNEIDRLAEDIELLRMEVEEQTELRKIAEAKVERLTDSLKTFYDLAGELVTDDIAKG